MSVQSMTGFGKGEAQGSNYSLTVEIKSVNNRFKDIRFKMGNVFNSLELPLKKKVENTFSRGSIDIYVNYKKETEKQKEIELDYNKIGEYISKISEIASSKKVQLSVTPTEFFKSEFYLEDGEKEDELIGLLPGAFDQALEQLKVSRIEEGEKVRATLMGHKESYIKFYQKVVELKSGYQDKVKEKLLKKFQKEKADLNIDDSRFLQEVIYYLEKLDIDEEVNRIQIHLEKLNKVLTSESEVGRQIDFLVQELNRETNTIGSKSGDSGISENIVQMKVHLEKIREQALNLQ